MVERVSVRADAAQPLVRSDHGKEKLTTIKFEDWSERCSLGVLLIVGGVLNTISGRELELLRSQHAIRLRQPQRVGARSR